jgi:probable rRNA maturation factor
MGVGITYVDDRAMRKLNREHRGINLSTDVLSFPAEAEAGAFPHLGDLVISLPMAEKMAKKLGVSRRREVETLVIHGFLHLCGYDHEKDGGEMMALQADLEREFLEAEPLPMSLRRGRKPGSKVKVLKDGTKVVVTGRAAAALRNKETATKGAGAGPSNVQKPGQGKRGPLSAAKPKRGPGRPPKVQPSAPAEALRRAPRRRRAARPRSGVIA